VTYTETASVELYRVWADRTAMAAVCLARCAIDRTNSTTTTPGRCGLTTEIHVLEAAAGQISMTRIAGSATTAMQVIVVFIFIFIHKSGSNTYERKKHTIKQTIRKLMHAEYTNGSNERQKP